MLPEMYPMWLAPLLRSGEGDFWALQLDLCCWLIPVDYMVLLWPSHHLPLVPQVKYKGSLMEVKQGLPFSP